MRALRVTGCCLLGSLFLLSGCASAAKRLQHARTVPPSAPAIVLTESSSPTAVPDALSLNGPLDRPEVRAYLEQIATEHHFDRQQLAQLFSEIKPLQRVVEAIGKPAEAQPWHKYRPRFIQPQQIERGAEFWRTHASELAKAELWFGVPPEIVVAILGVETRYGANPGNFRVIDSLATLGFEYAPRANFFRKELTEFLLLCREQGWDPRSLRGSYAGAMGLGQFMPSTYRRFAVDFNEDGVRDLRNTPSDAIGSIAYYLYSHGWGAGAPVVAPVKVSGDAYSKYLVRDFKADTALADLRAVGVSLNDEPGAERAGLFTLENTGGVEYWLGFANFYAITRYNRSVLYSMAVYELGQEIGKRYRNGLRLTTTD